MNSVVFAEVRGYNLQMAKYDYSKPIEFKVGKELTEEQKTELTTKLHALLDTMDNLNVTYVEQAAANGGKTGGMVTALPKA
jgi:hypothetical protein